MVGGEGGVRVVLGWCHGGVRLGLGLGLGWD